MRVAYLIISNELISLFQWCQFCFELNTSMVVEVEVFTYEEASLLIGAKFSSADALGLENRKEVLGYSIVIRISLT